MTVMAVCVLDKAVFQEYVAYSCVYLHVILKLE